MAVTYSGSYAFNPTWVLWCKLVIFVFRKIKQAMLYYYKFNLKVYFFDEDIWKNRNKFYGSM